MEGVRQRKVSFSWKWQMTLSLMDDPSPLLCLGCGIIVSLIKIRLLVGFPSVLCVEGWHRSSWLYYVFSSSSYIVHFLPLNLLCVLPPLLFLSTTSNSFCIIVLHLHSFLIIFIFSIKFFFPLRVLPLPTSICTSSFLPFPSFYMIHFPLIFLSNLGTSSPAAAFSVVVCARGCHLTPLTALLLVTSDQDNWVC